VHACRLIIAINLFVAACANHHDGDVEKPVPVVIPHPGYLDDCVPKLALRAGQQRRIDFEYEGARNENQFWWSDELKHFDDVNIKYDSEQVRNGLCGAVFELAFSTPIVFGELISQPGRGCGKFRRYCVRIQKPRKSGTPDPWSVSLTVPPCGEGDRN
jgi:hypothetical protein